MQPNHRTQSNSILEQHIKALNYMYKVHDENNIHLNKRGKQSLANQFQKAIKDAHYRNKLDAEFDIVV